jgi:hypothetical protein
MARPGSITITSAADVSTQAVSAGFITAASAANAGRVPAHSAKSVVTAINMNKHEAFQNLKTIAHKPFLVR